MKYLTPEIAALSKVKTSKTLYKKGTSCGIFQDLNAEATPYVKTEITPSKKL